MASFLVCVGPWPRAAVVLLFFLRRNANLTGGFAGRLAVGWLFLFVCLFVSHSSFLYSLDTRYVLFFRECGRYSSEARS